MGSSSDHVLLPVADHTLCKAVSRQPLNDKHTFYILQTKVYPVVMVKENEVMELRHVPMPRLPILSTVHCLPNNLVSVEGNDVMMM